MCTIIKKYMEYKTHNTRISMHILKFLLKNTIDNLKKKNMDFTHSNIFFKVIVLCMCGLL